MKLPTMLLSALLLAACGQSSSVETVESLIANPERLAELRDQCRDNRATVGEELCNAVAEATRQRFMGDGNVPYTPPAEQPKF